MKKPNVIFILADDMGYGDVSALNENCVFTTPNLDRMCEDGVAFTDAHSSSAVCTPSRYSILTGRYNWRSRLKSGVLGGYSEPLIEENRRTVANMFKDNGYKTAAIGKWHLGMLMANDGTPYVETGHKTRDGIDYSAPIERSPITYGFDYFYGIAASLDMPPYVYIENDRFTSLPDHITKGTGKRMWREGPTAPDFKHEEVLPKITDKVLDKIEEYKEDPFFIYFPLPAPHTPILPAEEFQGKSGTNEYGDFVLMVDDVVGKVVNKLKETGLYDNTIVIFTADNGCSPAASFEELLAAGHNPSYIFRGHKADIYEGGHRVPYIINWPEKIPAGKKCARITCLCDFLATMADYLGDKLPDDMAEDSVSNLSLWLDPEGAEEAREDLIHQSIDGSLSIRKGKYKLEMCPGSGGWSYPRIQAVTLDMPRFQLYDLENDIGETTNIIHEHPEVYRELKALLRKHIMNGRSTPGAPQKNNGTAVWQSIMWALEEVE